MRLWTGYAILVVSILLLDIALIWAATYFNAFQAQHDWPMS